MLFYNIIYVCKRCTDQRSDIFFFKQKTAYEIYQCDWSSDVCSSDLIRPAEARLAASIMISSSIMLSLTGTEQGWTRKTDRKSVA